MSETTDAAAPVPETRTLAERIGPVPAPALPAHPDVATWRTATPDDIDAIHSVIAAADAVDHPTWITPREDIADHFELSHIDSSRDTLLAFAADGTAVAVGNAFRHPSADVRIDVHLEGAVRPDWRRRGIGSRVMAWQYARGLEHLVASGSTLAGRLSVDAEDGDVGAVVIAERQGFATERWFSTMERDLTGNAPIADALVADTAGEGVAVVAWTPERSAAALDARNDAFRDHWGSLPTAPERWQKFVGGEFFRPDLSFLAIERGAGVDGEPAEERVVAFCLASVIEDDWAALGASHAYIDLIGVVRSHRRRGLAPLVIAHTLRAARDVGLERVVLDVDTESPTGANSLYDGLGFVATGCMRVLGRTF